MTTTFIFKFLEDNKDCRTISILDASIYNTQTPVTCPIIDVVVPNFSSKISFEYVPSSVIAINTQNLTLANCLNVLPSGLYKFRFSINPNAEAYISYNYLNICPDITAIAQTLCLDPCADKINTLMDYKKKLEAAKLLVEQCNNSIKGVALYNEVSKQISKLSKYCC